MATPGFIVTNIAGLKAIDMSTYNDVLIIFVSAKNAWYAYDPTDTLANNDEWIVEPTSGNGNGAWHPINAIFGTTTPTGATNHPVTYRFVDTACSAGDQVEALYFNPGGGSTNWTNTFIGNV